MSLLEDRDRGGVIGVAARIITGWALLGGIILCVVIGLNCWSVLAGALGSSFAPAYELTEVGVAVAAFSFLPYCQINDLNVTADIFTQNLSQRKIAGLKALTSVIALLFAVLMLWRMSLGLIDQKTYGYTTTIVQMPVWWAFIPILVSLALLAVAAVITLIETGTRVGTGKPIHG